MAADGSKPGGELPTDAQMGDLFVEGRTGLKIVMGVVSEASALAEGTVHEERMARIHRYTMLLHREATILGKEIGGSVAAKSGTT
jgi:hypothetical protein